MLQAWGAALDGSVQGMVVLGLFVLLGVSLSERDLASAGFVLGFGVILPVPFAIGSLVAWVLYKSNHRR